MSPQRFNNPAKSCGCPLLSKDFDEPGDLLLIKVWMYLKRFYGPTSSFPREEPRKFNFYVGTRLLSLVYIILDFVLYKT